MPKTIHIAIREFSSTVLTKGFIVGMLLTPVIMLVAIGAVLLLSRLEGPKVGGTIAVIDRSGVVAAGIEERFSEQGLERERERQAASVRDTVDQAADAFGVDDKQRDMAMGFGRTAAARAGAAGPAISVQVLPADADVEAEKAPVKEAQVRGPRPKDGEAQGPPRRLALVVIPPDAVRPADPAGGEGTAEGAEAGGDGYAPFEVYFADRLDFQIQQRVRDRVADSIVDARITTDPRAQAGSLGPAEVRGLLRSPRATSRTVTAGGEKAVSKLSEITSFMIPVAFMLLLMMSVMTGGQYLLTTTIEEKGSRVMEVLLSAVSPMQLMVGKIIGQMVVGLLILTLYSGVGVASLVIFSLDHLLNPFNMVYLLIFFLIAFFLVASFMAAVGSAVTELREAQSLMTPIMASMILPWLLVMPISRSPNAGWVTALSFVPGLNPFVMMIRLAGSEPIPAWQIPVAIGVGVLSAALAAMAAAKIFRVGVLMYGKPPNFRTLWRWVRMA